MSAARRIRRERARADAKAARRQPVLIAGDGIIAAEIPGHRYEAKPHADLAAKVPGEHRWICTAAWVMSADAIAGVTDPDVLKFMDHENMLSLAVGCWDCEQPLGQIDVGSACPASGDD